MNKDVQELYDWMLTALPWVPDQESRDGIRNAIAALLPRLSTVGCWIPCDADNPPPAAGPLLVWVQAYPDFPRGGLYSESGPRWVETWVGGGKLGHDVTHYMLIEEPK